MQLEARMEAIVLGAKINEVLRDVINMPYKVLPVFVHGSVDGDCIGSAASIVMLLRNCGINAVIAMPEMLPDNMDFLSLENIVEYDTDKLIKLNNDNMIPFGIAVDCSAASRMGKMGEVFDSIQDKMIVDHHKSSVLEGDGIWVEPDASSACEMVYLMLREYAYEFALPIESVITPEIAQCLLAGIVTDTGRFSYTNTKPSTLLASGELMNLGGKITPVCYNLFDRQTAGVTKLVGYALSKAQLYCDGKLAITTVYKSDLEKYNADENSIGSIVSTLRDIDTVEVAFVLRELDDGKVRVNIRSKSTFDCCEFAGNYGGGGHVRASGITFAKDNEVGDTDSIAKEIIEKASKLL